MSSAQHSLPGPEALRHTQTTETTVGIDFEHYTSEQLPPALGATYELETNPGRKFEDPFDFNNLRFYDRTQAINLVRELEGLDAVKRRRGSEESIVAFIGTGGTIAMVKKGNQLEPELDTEVLLGELAASKRGRFAAGSIQLPKMVDSSVMPPDVIADTALLMTAVWGSMSKQLQENFAGFVVTHGTDTLAQSAALSRMMLGRSVPFNTCFVGAQKTIQDSPNDVGANLDGALTSLALAHEDKGASHHFVFMNGTSGSAMNAAGVVKISDNRIEAFASPIHPPLVDVGAFAVGGLRRLSSNEFDLAYYEPPYKSSQPEFKPLIVRGDIKIQEIFAQQGRPAQWDRMMIEAIEDLDAVSVITFGGFTFPPANFEQIMKAAKERNLPVFVSNPFPGGSTQHEYGPAVRIRESGAEPVHMMPSALRAKVHVGRAMFGSDTSALLDWIRKDYVGEMPSSVAASGKSSQQRYTH